MTRRVYDQPPGQRKETPRARRAFECYRDLGPARSLSKLHAQFVQQAHDAQQAHATGQKGPDSPPTTSLKQLKEWSAVFEWTHRVSAWQAEQDAARRQEMIRQAARQARENAKLLQDVGAGLLGIVALRLNGLIDKDGALIGAVAVRDLAPLVKAGADLLAMAAGQALVAPQDDLSQLEEALRESDDETRQVILRGMRALLAWRERRDKAGAYEV